jgi:hypothetical protein
VTPTSGGKPVHTDRNHRASDQHAAHPHNSRRAKTI